MPVWIGKCEERLNFLEPFFADDFSNFPKEARPRDSVF